jgi:DNA primase small subunit
MLENNLKFLEETFKQYYFDHFDLIHVPDRSKEREYGYKKFNSGMIRHISLKTDKDLHLMLMDITLFQIYQWQKKTGKRRILFLILTQRI